MQPRKKAQQDAERFLDFFQKKSGIDWLSNPIHTEQALKMVDRAIRGYLCHPDTPSQAIFRKVISELFPGDLEQHIRPGRDLLLAIQEKSNECLDIKPIQNIEYAVRDILGKDFVLKILSFRRDILKKLVEFNLLWKPNLEANNKAFDHVMFPARDKINKAIEDCIRTSFAVKIPSYSHAKKMKDSLHPAVLAQRFFKQCMDVEDGLSYCKKMQERTKLVFFKTIEKIIKETIENNSEENSSTISMSHG